MTQWDTLNPLLLCALAYTRPRSALEARANEASTDGPTAAGPIARAAKEKEEMRAEKRRMREGRELK